MSHKNVLKIFKKYQKAGRKSAKRAAYLNVFEKKMIYRTTKTENPGTTKQLVNAVLKKIH